MRVFQFISEVFARAPRAAAESEIAPCGALRTLARMKLKLLLLALLPAWLAAADAKNCGCECCKGKDVCCCHADEAKPVAKRHALRGVITAVHADRGALMVKHEEIPGVMPAMTMLFKVDAATLQAAKKGQAIVGQMARENDEWWLHEVKPAPAK